MRVCGHWLSIVSLDPVVVTYCKFIHTYPHQNYHLLPDYYQTIAS